MKRALALLASLACLGVGFAFAIPTPVRNTHDPTLSNVATAPPHMSVKADVAMAMARFSEMQFHVLALTCESQSIVVVETENFSGIKDPGGTANFNKSVISALMAKSDLRMLVGTDTTAPPLNSGTLLRFTANVCAASAHGGGRNAEIV